MSEMETNICAAARIYMEATVAFDLAATEEDVAPEGALRLKMEGRVEAIAERRDRAYANICDTPARTQRERLAKVAVMHCESKLRGDLTEIELSVIRDLLGFDLDALGDNEATAASEFLRRGLV
ncbi:hypothetical protein [Paracraurococcus lichenis]|uniref:Co-chaperone DjlA N-terminal domain-containing protein n=1 Tax=Paracraurococcus lichenis TaxID=3064888 RepID=A0ABT9E885_9PROT|nr:hypothetical protein [Paracraurococcus sp. LOR1-02]MDO9712384.1 hypothetical protein [Paracraurococcus sp. LOR1-02]